MKRAPLPLALFVAGLVAAPPSLPAQEGDPGAVERVEGWIEATGGMETYREMRSAVFTFSTELYDAETGRLRRARPRYVYIAKLATGEASRIERWEGDDYIVQGFDGEGEAWATMNGEVLPDTAKDAREALYVARDVFYWFGLPWKLTDPGAHLHDRGTDGRGHRVVGVTFGEGVGEHQDTWLYHFDEGEAWPAEVHYIEEGHEDANRTVWTDIRTVDGYPHVGARLHPDDEGRVTKIIRRMDVVINPDLDPAIFRDPDAVPSAEVREAFIDAPRVGGVR